MTVKAPPAPTTEDFSGAGEVTHVESPNALPNRMTASEIAERRSIGEMAVSEAEQ